MSEGTRKQEYISVGELSVGFSENIVESTNALAGKEVKLYYESGREAVLTFIDTEAFKWETKDQGREEQFICAYRAIMPRKNIYFVDFIVSYGDSRSVSVILDMQEKIATIITGIMHTRHRNRKHCRGGNSM